ncbi:unnamed protein product [Allacma fusca]|uniref:DUF5641 domain-containing protein n=1 Tax=Allacma fusca TaxID=39272 RepID=A0A8J2KUL3_9HEXA|nr:unnamed protein product [Allacma fusca]
MGNTLLNYEEFYTVLAQIEACVNSRPISPLSSSPDDFLALTPGHFLIGGPLNAIMEPDLSDVHLNRLSRWQLGQRILQDFWKRWKCEHLSRLQQRPKWIAQSANIEVGALVLLKDDRLPPLQWLLGRIASVIPGDDGLVRVVTVKTKEGEYKRPLVKVIPLPVMNIELPKAKID